MVEVGSEFSPEACRVDAAGGPELLGGSTAETFFEGKSGSIVVVKTLGADMGIILTVGLIGVPCALEGVPSFTGLASPLD